MWYKKHLDCYEVPYSNIPLDRVESCNSRIANLQSSNPIISVVIIAYNEEERLFACLESLSNSLCKYPIEILGIDNNSKDNTSKVFNDCGVKYFLEEQQGHGFARNCGLYNAKGKYYLCIDSDTLYPTKYIEKMADILVEGKYVAVNSRFGYIATTFMDAINMQLYEFLRNVHYNLKSYKRPESIVRGFVFGFNIELAKKIGGFRTNIKRGEDGSLALGLKQFGPICFLKSNKAKAITGLRALQSEGSVFKAFTTRVFKEIKNIKYYFYRKTNKECVDGEENLMK